MSKPVSTTHLTYVDVQGGKVAVLTMDSAPVNSLSRGTRAGIIDGVVKLSKESNVLAVVIRGAGRAFCAGAEISEFAESGAPGAPKEESLVDTIARLENAKIPVVALVHGFALGGGFEVALACHYRVATPDAMFGLPEVNLGLLPGAGGTQRLPRIIGALPACDMILSGKPINAKKALQLGVADALLTSKDTLKEAIEFIVGKPPRPTAALQVKMNGASKEETLQKINQMLASPAITKARKGEIAPDFIAGCIRASLENDFAYGMKEEQRLFMGLLTSKESRALQHMFFAERAAAKLPKDVASKLKGSKPAPIQKVGIIGSGTMGGGIAMCCAEAGMEVFLVDINQQFLDNGMKVIAKNYARSVERKSISQKQMDERMAKIHPTTKYEDLSDVDIVVEAVFENLKLKQDIFRRLDAVCKPTCILSSNTSGLDIDQIANVTKRPELVVGCHFFSPANQMQLLENVRGKASSPETLYSVTEFGKRIKKVPILVGNCPGFLGNRMLDPYSFQAYQMAIEGANIKFVDDVAKNVIGMSMGPFSVHDLVGLDVFWRKRKDEGTVNVDANISDALCEQGRFGQKTGKGFYTYTAKGQEEDPVVLQAIENVSNKQGVYRRKNWTETEVVERLLYPLINEGFKCLEEGIASKPSDIDACYIFGYGFPRSKGGPMKYAEEIGFDTVLAGLRKYQRLGNKEQYFVPSKLLVRLVEEKKMSFSKM